MFFLILYIVNRGNNQFLKAIRVIYTAGTVSLAGPASTGSNFHNNVSKNYPQDLKMVKKNAPRDSLQSALKIRS